MMVLCGNCEKSIDPDDLEIIDHYHEYGIGPGYDEVCPECLQDPEFTIVNETVSEALGRVMLGGISLDVFYNIEEDGLRLAHHNED